MQDISGFGLQIHITASVTYPGGYTFTQFADDADPLDVPVVQMADKGMGLNGDLITWGKAVPIEMVTNLIPGSEDDAIMSHLADANMVGKGRTSARDVIEAVITYPDGQSVTLKSGKLTNAPLAAGVASAGRKKTSAYTFVFETIARSTGGDIAS